MKIFEDFENIFGTNLEGHLLLLLHVAVAHGLHVVHRHEKHRVVLEGHLHEAHVILLHNHLVVRHLDGLHHGNLQIVHNGHLIVHGHEHHVVVHLLLHDGELHLILITLVHHRHLHLHLHGAIHVHLLHRHGVEHLHRLGGEHLHGLLEVHHVAVVEIVALFLVNGLDVPLLLVKRVDGRGGADRRGTTPVLTTLRGGFTARVTS